MCDDTLYAVVVHVSGRLWGCEDKPRVEYVEAFVLHCALQPAHAHDHLQAGQTLHDMATVRLDVSKAHPSRNLERRLC